MSRYMPHRRARFPSIWPVALVNAPIAAALAAFVSPHWLAVVLVLVLGISVPWARLALWRRRHPVISPGELLDDIRKAAPWN